MSHSNNTIRVAINDEATLKELIKDPEVVVRCKDAIVKGVAKYVLNAAQEELNKSIDDFIRQAIQDYCHPRNGKESEWFKETPYGAFGRVQVTERAREAIRNTVEDVLLRQCRDVVDNVTGNRVEQELDSAVASKLQEIGEFDVEEAFNKRLDKYIWDRMRQRPND